MRSTQRESVSLHEPAELLSPATKDLHRAILSLMEELEAVDWYQQRADACDDDALRAVLIHNKNEEVEHAMMNLEWIRRNSPVFDANARRYLFTSGSIVATEGAATAGAATGDAVVEPPSPPSDPAPGSLGLGSLKG